LAAVLTAPAPTAVELAPVAMAGRNARHGAGAEGRGVVGQRPRAHADGAGWIGRGDGALADRGGADIVRDGALPDCVA
jgi:hypothetical protein